MAKALAVMVEQARRQALAQIVESAREELEAWSPTDLVQELQRLGHHADDMERYVTGVLADAAAKHIADCGFDAVGADFEQETADAVYGAVERLQRRSS